MSFLFVLNVATCTSAKISVSFLIKSFTCSSILSGRATNLNTLTLPVADFPEVADMWWNSNSAGNSYTIYKGPANYGNEMAAGYNTYTNDALVIGMDGYNFLHQYYNSNAKFVEGDVRNLTSSLKDKKFDISKEGRLKEINSKIEHAPKWKKAV